jgi:hypothetical protein
MGLMKGPPRFRYPGEPIPQVGPEADNSTYDRRRAWFVWGNILAWVVIVPFIFGLFNSFRGISEQKATGLGAVAGGIAEVYTTFGFILAFALPLGAIVLLVRSFSVVHGMSALLSLLSICASAYSHSLLVACSCGWCFSSDLM